MFQKLVSKLARGEEIGTVQAGWLCVPNSKLYWKRGGQVNVGDDELADVLKQELVSAGYKVVGDPTSLFDEQQEWKAEYLIGGVLRHTALNICYPMAGFGNFTNSSGEASIEVEWQIFERRTRSVVFSAVTGGTAKTSSGPQMGLQAYYDAFAKSVRSLLADNKFVALVSRNSETVSTDDVAPLEIEVLALTETSPVNVSELISYAQNTVVTIPVGSGHGSGVVITSSGLMLTNAHVVGEGSGSLMVDLANGRRVAGTVLRTNKKADIALVQLEPGKYQAAPVGVASETKVGDSVFAIGTPLNEKFNRTVTKGIISAFRNEDGVRSIQSDVVIHPGSSGGPLLDSQGRVVGIASSGVVTGRGVGIGLNYFIPIDDGLSGLQITTRRVPVKTQALVTSTIVPQKASGLEQLQLELEQRLRVIQELKEKKLITDREAEQRRNEILDKLSR
jgi:S1-C subfamily serine protease